MADDIELAPPPTVVDGLTAVPIDIQTIDAQMLVDCAAQAISVDVTMNFVTGPVAGHPLFDLRQTPAQAWLDGASYPVGQLGHRDLGGGPGAELRMLGTSLAPGTSHTLRLTYTLATPIGTSTAAGTWSAGPRVGFRFAMNDLDPAEYLEMWLPANLIYDRFALAIELQITGTTVTHAVVTNGALTNLGLNHFAIAFPGTFTALSHLLELRPADQLVGLVDTVVLPVSGTTVTIEAHKPVSSPSDLAGAVGILATALAGFDGSAGAYAHGDRFVLYLGGGGMEYDGATTTGVGALVHEAHHSWWGRGIKPALGRDGWWDEAWTTYVVAGASGAVPFDFGDPPVVLSPRNPWIRHTPGASYSAGRRLFEGIAAATSAASLVARMRSFYTAHALEPVATEQLEAHLIATTGEPMLVDAFHRFVYGLGDPSPGSLPRVWLRDAVGHTGTEHWDGTFWDSPDLWVRHAADGGTSHEPPTAEADNWFYARVRNLATGGTAEHFVVTFTVKPFAGTQFVYPADFLPAITATVEFDLGPGESRIVRARWPADQVPPAGAHACLLAAVIARGDHPTAGTHVWEHGNLAQKNLTIAPAASGNTVTVPFVFGNSDRRRARALILELVRPRGWEQLDAALIVREGLFARIAADVRRLGAKLDVLELPADPESERLECGLELHADAARTDVWTSVNPRGGLAQAFAGARRIWLPEGRSVSVPVSVHAGDQHHVAVQLRVPADARPDERGRVHIIKRDAVTRQILGGIAVELITIASPTTPKPDNGDTMKSPNPKEFIDGKQYLVRIRGQAAVTTDAKPAHAVTKGELVVRLHGDHPTVMGVEVVRLALALESVDASGGPTGRITIKGAGRGGSLKFADDGSRVEVGFEAGINHPSLDRVRVPGCERSHAYEPAFADAIAKLSIELGRDDDGLLGSKLKLGIVSTEDPYGEIIRVELQLDGVRIEPLLPARGSVSGVNRARSGDSEANNNACDPSLEVNKRKIVCQPVGFRSSATDVSPSGWTAGTQFATAQSVWAKACIEIEVNPIHYITDATLKTSSDLTAIRASYTHADPDVIEVYFVDNLLPVIGGGSAGAIGVASCKVCMAEPNSGNPVLLAHELGHVLGLSHPGATDPNTVMIPTGGADNPGTEMVSHYMATQISNPVLETLTSSCCLGHDIGDHYLRDFPVDVGSEPSDPLPAGMTRYSMSNVWNRRSNTPGSWSATIGPEHEDPARFQTDGVTPFTNYLHARVEQLETIKVRDAKVRFYLKHPGSGGGGANLQLLGEAPVPSSLAVGSPQTVSLAWVVPTATPAHSCVFAVVASPAEPEGDQTALNWWQFEALARADNDWAQRNLNLIDTSSNAGNSDSNQVASAPIIIKVPPDTDARQLPLQLVVDARAAAGLAGLAIEIPGKERLEVAPGKQVTLQPKTPLTPGQDYVLVIQGIIPAGVSLGRTFTIDVEPVVGKTRMAGYSAQLRVARARAVIAGVLDGMMAALTDLAHVTDQPGAHRLRELGLRLVEQRPYTLEALAKGALELQAELAAIAKAAAGHPEAARYDMRAATERMRAAGEAFEKRSGPALAVVEALRDAVARAGMIAFTLRDIPGALLPGTVQVVVDRLEVLYDHDLLGPGECYFTATIVDGHGHAARARFPECGYYSVDAGCCAANIQLCAPIYTGDPGGSLKIVFEGRELDTLSRDDKFTRYEIELSGDASAMRGAHAPRGPGGEMPDWRVYFRVI